MHLIRQWWPFHQRPKNSLFTIFPYLKNGIWVFDDDSVGLKGEALVQGIPEIISFICAEQKVANPEKGFSVIFSKDRFPSVTHALDRLVEVDHEFNVLKSFGTWYRLRGTEMDGWLCPALLRYFDKPPDTLWLSIGSV